MAAEGKELSKQLLELQQKLWADYVKVRDEVSKAEDEGTLTPSLEERQQRKFEEYLAVQNGSSFALMPVAK